MSDQEDDLEFDNGEQDFRDSGSYSGEHIEGEEEVHHMGYLRDDRQYDPDMSFERDVERMTKVKARLMFNLNRERQLEQLPLICEDITLTSIAMQYATSLKGSEGNQAYMKRLMEQERIDIIDFKTCQLISNYEEGVQVTKNYTEKFFVESSYLFLEMDREREVLMDPLNTHVGVGLAGNESAIVVVMLVTSRELAILEVEDMGDENRVEVRGKMLDSLTGICGVKVYNSEYKEICSVLYDKIDFNRVTREFCVYLELDKNWKERRWVELFVRDNPDSIAYRKLRKDKDKDKTYFKHLKMRLRSLFIEYPDKEYVRCFNELAEIEADKTQTMMAGMILESVSKDMERREEQIQHESIADESSKMDDEDDFDDDLDQKDQQLKEQMTSNKQIKEELVMAIGEAKNTYDTLADSNRMQQEKIKELREKHNIFLDKTTETSMNEHKYLNILAQVHQTRVELQQTQDRYNRMSLELQNKLNQKQSKCNEIRSAFQDLKREVAKKATYSRSDQPIKGYKIQQWEGREAGITQDLQNLRLQILRARNSLSKNQKILKKKEELAEGLHLIDFEQLKIENQTLNEKIEERNEDLHKLKKKTTTMVQILTHTREKLVFVEKMKANLHSTAAKLDITSQGLRGEISITKENCQKLRLEIQDAKQETQIVNSQELVVDYKKRSQHIAALEREIDEMLETEKEMKTVIEMYQRKIRKQVVTK